MADDRQTALLEAILSTLRTDRLSQQYELLDSVRKRGGGRYMKQTTTGTLHLPGLRAMWARISAESTVAGLKNHNNGFGSIWLNGSSQAIRFPQTPNTAGGGYSASYGGRVGYEVILRGPIVDLKVQAHGPFGTTTVTVEVSELVDIAGNWQVPQLEQESYLDKIMENTAATVLMTTPLYYLQHDTFGNLKVINYT